MDFSKPEQVKVVDLFCGIGGLSHGFVKENLHVAAGFDIDGKCKYPFEENNNATFFERDIRQVTAKEVKKIFGKTKIKILVGCAPCQPFSTYAFKSPDKQQDKENGKWGLLYEFARLIKGTKPDIVSMENVPGVAKFNKSEVFRDFVKFLEDNKYFVDFREVYCPEYGIPQHRRRLVLLASRLRPIMLKHKTHDKSNFLTVKDAIGKLEPLKHGEISKTDEIHRAAKLSDLNLQRIRQSKPGGSWKDWDKALVLECHKKESGKSYGSVYGRMKWDEPAPTMTTFCTGIGNGRFGHPEQDRAISIREAALIQTFPAGYKFVEDGAEVSAGHLTTHIGNAVPVKLGQVIAQSIKFHLRNDF